MTTPNTNYHNDLNPSRMALLGKGDCAQCGATRLTPCTNQGRTVQAHAARRAWHPIIAKAFQTTVYRVGNQARRLKSMRRMGLCPGFMYPSL